MSEFTLNTLLCAEYEEILTGKRKQLSNSLLKKYNHSKYYVPMMRYVFEEMLRWTPEDVKLYISMDVIRALKLECITGLIEIPAEIDIERDSFYLAHVLYPEQYPYDFRISILTEYKRRIEEDEDGKIKNGFFDDEKGRIAARICLRYAVEHHLPLVSSEKIYEFFSDPEKAGQFLKDYKLKNAYQIHYESELEYLHDAMLPPMRCELYYWYYIFRKQFNEDKKIYQKETEIGKVKRNAVNSKGEKRKPRQKRSNTGKKTGTGTDQDLP